MIVEHRCSPTISEEENATPGTLFLELFFGDWIDKLRDIFHKVVETPSNFEDFIESPFFTTTALPNCSFLLLFLVSSMINAIYYVAIRISIF